MRKVIHYLLLLITISLLVTNKLKSQSFSWAYCAQHAGWGSYACDSDNIITAGRFNAPFDVDPSTNTVILTPVSPYDFDMFVSKVNGNGNLIWAKHFDGSTNPYASVFLRRMTKDESGNLYIVGDFKDSIDFDPSSGTFYIPVPDTNNQNAFIVKLSSSGDFLWAKGLGGVGTNSNVTFYDIQIRGTSIYTTGAFHGTIDVNPGLAINNITAGSAGSGFIEKLDTAGNYQWNKQINGAGIQFLQLDSLSNIYCEGNFKNTVDFDPGVGVFNMNGGTGTGFALFFEKLDSAGNFIWAKQIGTGINNEHTNDIAIDRKGNLYATGYFNNTLDFDPGPGIHALSTASNDFYLLKLNTNGDYSWANTIGATDGRSVTTDSLCNVYTTGEYSGGDLDPGPGIYMLNTQGSSDVFVQKLDSSGNFIWAETFGSSGYDIPGLVRLDRSNNIIISGLIGAASQGGFGDFDPGLGVCTLGGTNAGFIEKLCIAPSPLNITLLNDTICVGQTTYLSVEAFQGATYIWGLDGNPIANSNHDTLIATQAGNYTVAIYGVGCPYSSDTIHLAVLPFITPNIQISSSPNYVPAGQQVTVFANIWNNSGYAYTINWYNHGVLFATTTTNSTTYTKQVGRDSITADITLNTPCTTPVTSNYAVVTGIGDIYNQPSFSIYPNPTSNFLTIQTSQLGKLEITDLTGRLLLQASTPLSYQNSTPLSSQILDISSLAKGVYLLRFVSNEGAVETVKVLKE